MNIVSGDKVLMEFSTFGDRFLSIVTDVREDGRLLVYSPIPDVVVDRLRTDDSARVRFAFEGRLRGFATRILNLITAPGSMLELAAPDEIYDAEDRAEPRCSCRFPAVVRDGGREYDAVVEDMSASCARVRFLNGDVLPGGSMGDRAVGLTFHPFDMENGYGVECDVRSSFLKDGARYAVLAYRSEEAEARERINRFVEAQLRCGLPRL